MGYKINKLSVIFFIVAIIHYIISFLLTPKYNEDFLFYQKLWYFVIKTVSFILITVFWQFVSKMILAIKSGDKSQIDIVKYTLIYFVVNLILLFICFPYLSCENSIIFVLEEMLKGYNINVHPSFLQALIYNFAYQVFPCIIGAVIVLLFCYSTLFSFFFVSVKEKFKIYHFLLVPFFLPFVLGFNQQPTRIIEASWLLLFIFSYIYFNQSKNKDNLLNIILFAIITAISAKMRSEYFILVLIIPVMLFLLNVFKKKMIILFTVILCLFYGLLHLADNAESHYHYELHNVSFIYDDYLKNNGKYEEIEKNKELLNNVFKLSMEYNGTPSSIDNYYSSSDEDKKKAVYILIKYALYKRAPYYIVHNFKTITYRPLEHLIVSDQQMLIDAKEQEEDRYIPEIYLKQSPFSKKVSEVLTFSSGKSKIFGFLYNPGFYFCILIFMFIYGIVARKLFFVIMSCFWTIVSLFVLIFMQFDVLLYFYPLFLNIIVFLFIMFSEIINKIYSHRVCKNF